MRTQTLCPDGDELCVFWQLICLSGSQFSTGANGDETMHSIGAGGESPDSILGAGAMVWGQVYGKEVPAILYNG